jgi:hypothetical protein
MAKRKIPTKEMGRTDRDMAGPAICPAPKNRVTKPKAFTARSDAAFVLAIA